jgi:glycosyltransferase involved in cell wall biosynthesis
MRILITGTTGDAMPPPYGGVPKVSLWFARIWKSFGHDVAVTFVYKPKNADDINANAEYFFEYAGKPNKFKKLLFFVRYFTKNPILYLDLFRSYYSIYPYFSTEIVLYSAYGVFMDGVIKKFKPDIITSQAALIKSFMVAKVANRRHIPVVYEAYAEIHAEEMGVNKNLNLEGRKKYWEYFLGLSDMIITLSNCSIGALMYLPAEKVKVFYDTCDYHTFHDPNPGTKREMRERFKLPLNAFIVGMVGAFHYRKGQHHLIEAIGNLKKRGITVCAVICGGSLRPEEDIEKWKILAEKFGVLDNVFFFSNIHNSELIKLHRTLDLYCNLSFTERSCDLDLALLEAMSSSLPLIVYDTGALSDAVPGEENGFLVKINDIMGVTDAIEKMVSKSESELKLMGTKSAELAEKRDINLTGAIKIGWFTEIIKNYKK